MGKEEKLGLKRRSRCDLALFCRNLRIPEIAEMIKQTFFDALRNEEREESDVFWRFNSLRNGQFLCYNTLK